MDWFNIDVEFMRRMLSKNETDKELSALYLALQSCYETLDSLDSDSLLYELLDSIEELVTAEIVSRFMIRLFVTSK